MLGTRGRNSDLDAVYSACLGVQQGKTAGPLSSHQLAEIHKPASDHPGEGPDVVVDIRTEGDLYEDLSGSLTWYPGPSLKAISRQRSR